jgi:cold shock CspA family protein
MQSSQRHRGKLVVWNDDRGFGFIQPNNGSKRVFIHIKAIGNATRRLQLNDIIQYDLIADESGKTKAINAIVEGLPVSPASRVDSRSKRSPSSRKSANQTLNPKVLISIVCSILGMGFFISSIANSFMRSSQVNQSDKIPSTLARPSTTKPVSSAAVKPTAQTASNSAPVTTQPVVESTPQEAAPEESTIPEEVEFSDTEPLPQNQPEPSEPEPKSSNQNFQCAGKVHCSEMTSCEEATFYLQNCPNVKIDGNGDGIPCEKQFCGG